jgi:hypothetical protein
MKTEKMTAAVQILRRSERGVRVARQLETFLGGECSDLDGQGRSAVLDLMEEYLVGRNPATTVDLVRSIQDSKPT